jgi:hypothetical protein
MARWRSLMLICASRSQKRALHHGFERRLGAIEGPPQAAEKPLHPRRHIERPLLGALEDVVVLLSLDADLRRHAVKALRTLLRARQLPVRDRARDAPVAVIKRVDGHKPQMGQRRPQDRIGSLLTHSTRG